MESLPSDLNQDLWRKVHQMEPRSSSGFLQSELEIVSRYPNQLKSLECIEDHTK